MTREPIYAALFQFFEALTVGGSPLFKTASRRFTLFSVVEPEDTPALYQQQVREIAKYRKGLPTIWTLNVNLHMYVTTEAMSDTEVVPSELINPLLDAVESSFTVDNLKTFSSTLGGLVSHCAISGPIDIYQNDQGDESIAVVPIEIVVSP